jgi:hypothetical protein
MAELRIPIIGEFKGKKAFDDASKSTGKLDKGVKKLAVAIAAAFSVQKIAQFGKAAAKAFIADEKAASQLAVSVKNLGLAFETPRIEEFISKLSQASGVADDVLRPSMQKLLTTTGSLTKSQDLLTQALDISRGSGVDYETVVNDLTMAYVGQTRGLRKYSLGLTQAELKTMKFSDVQEKLNKQFSGANAAYLETYAGRMELLGTAADEASEIIGKGLMDSLMILSGDTSVEDLAVTMQELATNTANVITELAKLGKATGDFVVESYEKVDSFSDKLTDFFDRITGNSERITRRNVGQAGRSFGGGSGGAGGNIADIAARRKAEADAAKRAKELATMQKKSFDTQKKQNALAKASKTLNLEAISIEAALKGQISETDRLSLLLQKAILGQNASLATQLSDQLEAAIKRQNDLRNSLVTTPEAPNPYRNWTIPQELLNYTATSLGVSVAKLQTAPIPITSSMTDAQMELAAAVNANQAAEAKVINVAVYLGDTEITGAVTNVQQNASLAGTFSDVSRYNGRGAPSIK